MAGNARKKEEVTKHLDYISDFDDFDIEEIDIDEIIGRKPAAKITPIHEEKDVEIKKEEKTSSEKKTKKVNVEKVIEKNEPKVDKKIVEKEEPKVEEKKEKKESKVKEEKKIEEIEKEDIKKVEEPKKAKVGRKKKEDKNIIEFIPKQTVNEVEENIEESKEEKKVKNRRKNLDTLIEKIEKQEKNFKILKEEPIEKNTIQVKRKMSKTEQYNKEIKMQVDDTLNMMTLTLKQKKCKIDVMEEEYNVYTNNTNSYIIARQNKLCLEFKNAYLNIEKVNDLYRIETDENFVLDYVACDLIKEDNRLTFSVSNLSYIEVDEEDLRISIDAAKMAENKLEDNDTLIISEEDGKVFLPYTKEEVLEELKESKNATIEDIIRDNYVKPIEIYKNATKARFNEAYKLMRYKEKQSKNKAVMLGLELMFEFNLHPAIISACKNLEELDIYLDCLEDNELEKFSCFKIIYKAMPTLSKKRRK